MPKGVYVRTEYHRRINSLGHKGQIPPSRRGAKLSESHKAALLRAVIGNKFCVGKKISKAHIEALRNSWIGKHLSPEHRMKISLAQRGEKSKNWKGGASSVNKRLRMSVDFKLWREAVYLRDNWTCQKCLIRGGTLHPHHIKPFASFPDLRFDVSNGLTVCKKCHQEIHKGRVLNGK